VVRIFRFFNIIYLCDSCIIITLFCSVINSLVCIDEFLFIIRPGNLVFQFFIFLNNKILYTRIINN